MHGNTSLVIDLCLCGGFDLIVTNIGRNGELRKTLSDPNRFIELDIENVELVSGTMQVICHFQPAPVQMNVISFGCYCAVVVSRVDGDAVSTSTII